MRKCIDKWINWRMRSLLLSPSLSLSLPKWVSYLILSLLFSSPLLFSFHFISSLFFSFNFVSFLYSSLGCLKLIYDPGSLDISETHIYLPVSSHPFPPTSFPAVSSHIFLLSHLISQRPIDRPDHPICDVTDVSVIWSERKK